MKARILSSSYPTFQGAVNKLPTAHNTAKPATMMKTKDPIAALCLELVPLGPLSATEPGNVWRTWCFPLAFAFAAKLLPDLWLPAILLLLPCMRMATLFGFAALDLFGWA